MCRTKPYLNNRIEDSHRPTRRHERQMQRLESAERLPGFPIRSLVHLWPLSSASAPTGRQFLRTAPDRGVLDVRRQENCAGAAFMIERNIVAFVPRRHSNVNVTMPLRLLAHSSEAAAAGWPEALIGCRRMNAPAAVSNGAFRAPISVASSPCATSTGDWPTAIDRGTFEALIEPRLPQGRHRRRAGRPRTRRRQIHLARDLAHEAVIHGRAAVPPPASCSANWPRSTAIRAASPVRRYVCAIVLVDRWLALFFSNRHAD